MKIKETLKKKTRRIGIPLSQKKKISFESGLKGLLFVSEVYG